MTLDRACELIQARLGFGGGSIRSAVRLILALILAEIGNANGQGAFDRPIREIDVEERFGLVPCADFSGIGR